MDAHGSPPHTHIPTQKLAIFYSDMTKYFNFIIILRFSCTYEFWHWAKVKGNLTPLTHERTVADEGFEFFLRMWIRYADIALCLAV